MSGPGTTVERLLPYGAAQLFQLAADMERYPEYLPGWIAVRIRKREAGAYYTEQVVGLGPIRLEFSSRVVLRPPERIDVTSDDPRFRAFRLWWLFEPQPDGLCRVSVTAAVQFRSRVLQRAAHRAVAAAAGNIIDAFDARARRLYGR